MNKYTIYCTEEQTRKALELGAPIEKHYKGTDGLTRYYEDVIPTAEEMIGWIEEQGILVDTSAAFLHTNTPSYLYRIGFRFNDYVSDVVDYPSRKEATLAAIDAALEYLSRNKKEEE